PSPTRQRGPTLPRDECRGRPRRRPWRRRTRCRSTYEGLESRGEVRPAGWRLSWSSQARVLFRIECLADRLADEDHEQEGKEQDAERIRHQPPLRQVLHSLADQFA